MATFQKYRRKDGSTGITAIVRVTGFDPARQAFDSRAEAEAWASEYESELKARRTRGDARRSLTSITLREVIALYMADPKTRQLRSVDRVEAMLGYWANRLGDEPMRTVGKQQLATVRAELLASRPANHGKASTATLSAGRVNRYLAAMRACWRWAVAEGYARQAWPARIMLTEAKPRAVTATREELAEMFAECDAESRDLGTLARFLVGTGARLSDALAVTWRDVSIEDRQVTLGGQKTGKPYRVAMLPPAVEACTRAAEVPHVSRRVLWQWRDAGHPREAWQRARKNFPGQLKGIRLHDCRHLCASLLAAAGASSVQLAAQLNHSTLQMVQRYSHLQPAHRSAAHDAVDALFGVAQPKTKQ